MRNVRSLLLSTAVLPLVLTAQDCTLPWTEARFAVSQELGIPYDTVVTFDGSTQILHLDLYKPIGDGQTARPLVIAIHGGAFVEGDRTNMAAYCESLASYGYAAATISYRLGFHRTPVVPLPYDEAEVTRAAYRGQLDTRSAIRFLKSRSTLDSTLTDKVILLGGSAGAINAMHAAYAEAGAAPPAGVGAMAPVNVLGVQHARPDLGPMDGSPAAGAPDTDVLAVASIMGGLMDTALITTANGPALFQYHQSGDPVVGCGHQRGLWGVPLVNGTNFPYLYGSCMIDIRVRNLGYSAQRYQFMLHDGNEHDLHDPVAILDSAAHFMRDQICGISTAVRAAHAKEESLHVWPNPAAGNVTVELPARLATNGSFRLIDAMGRAVLNERSQGIRSSIDLSGIAPGMHVLEYITGSGEVFRSKLQLSGH